MTNLRLQNNDMRYSVHSAYEDSKHLGPGIRFVGYCVYYSNINSSFILDVDFIDPGQANTSLIAAYNCRNVSPTIQRVE
jgi:hypothetical protein